MKSGYLTLIIFLIAGCDIFDSDENNTAEVRKVYTAMQGLDQVAVLDGNDLELIRTIDIDFGMTGMNNTPHFISIDKVNNYWFVTTIMSGYVAMYDMESDELLDTLHVGDSPALLTVDSGNQLLYCSRMMPMSGMMMGSQSQVIQKIDYSTGMLLSVGEYEIGSPAPHGITILPNSGLVMTASNTADWLYKIDPSAGGVIGTALDADAWSPADVEIQRLKPIQCTAVDENQILVTCSAGKWMNPYGGEETDIRGNIQLWDTEGMTMLDSLNFHWSSKPWHSVISPVDNKLFIVLSGDGPIENSPGVASVSADNDELTLNWIARNEQFHTLHGIDISGDGEFLYISSRSTGELHMVDAYTGEYINSVSLSVNSDMVMCGGVAAQ